MYTLCYSCVTKTYNYTDYAKSGRETIAKNVSRPLLKISCPLVKMAVFGIGKRRMRILPKIGMDVKQSVKNVSRPFLGVKCIIIQSILYI